MLKKVKKIASSAYQTVSNSSSREASIVQEGQGANPKSKKVKSAYVLGPTTLTSLFRRFISSPVFPIEVVYEVIKNLRPAERVKFRAVNPAYRDLIDTNFLGQLSVKLTFSDVFDILNGQTNETLEFAKKHSLSFSLDLEALCESSDGLDMAFEIISNPAVANVSHISFGQFNDYTFSILELIEFYQHDLLKLLSSISVTGIGSDYSPIFLKVLNIKFLSIGILSGGLNAMNLENLTSLQIGDMSLFKGISFPDSIEQIVIGAADTLDLCDLPNLRFFTACANSLTLRDGLDSLEVVNYYGDDSSALNIYNILPKLTKIMIPSLLEKQLREDECNLPVLKEITYL